MFKYLFVFIFIFVFAWFDKSLGYSTTSSVYTHFTYMFQHAGVIHLTVNSLTFIGMFRSVEKYINKYILSITIISISVASSFLSIYDMPTVGASSMIYAMIGIYIPIIILYDKAIIINKKKYTMFIFFIFISLIISYLKNNSNFWLHVYSLLIGISSGIIVSIYKNEKL